MARRAIKKTNGALSSHKISDLLLCSSLIYMSVSVTRRLRETTVIKIFASHYKIN